MKIMAIDYGKTRVGIALTDELGIIAQPYLTLQEKSLKALIKRLKFIIEENGVGLVLVGNPLSTAGKSTKMSEEIGGFIEYLKKNVSVHIKLWDERFTSQYAAAKLNELGIQNKQKREKLDQVAAAIILEEYLNSSMTG